MLMAEFGQGRLPWAFFPSKAEVLPEPLGLVLIIGSWNFPICKFSYILIEIFHFLLFFFGQELVCAGLYLKTSM